MGNAEERYLEHFQDGRLRDCSSKEAFLLGYHQAEKDLADAFINKAVEWIDKNAFRYIVTRKYQGLDVTGLDTSLAADFKKTLEDML